MVTLTTLTASIHLDAGTVGPGVVEGVMTVVNFFDGHEVSRGVFKDDLWGKAVVGVGLGEGGCAVVAVFLELKEVLLHFCNVVSGAVDVGVEGTVAHNFSVGGVVFF